MLSGFELYPRWVPLIPKNCSNPEETQIWEGENESVSQQLILQLLLVIAAFIWQARIGLYANGLMDVQEKPKILKRGSRDRVFRNSSK